MIVRVVWHPPEAFPIFPDLGTRFKRLLYKYIAKQDPGESPAWHCIPYLPTAFAPNPEAINCASFCPSQLQEFDAGGCGRK
jgi:hypothetical protein